MLESQNQEFNQKLANTLSNKYRMDENELPDPEKTELRIKAGQDQESKKKQEKSKDEKIDELLKIIDELNSNTDDKKKSKI